MRVHKILLAFAVSFVAAVPLHAGEAGETTKAVIKAIEARDCVAAVRELNLALAGSSAEAFLLGGAMFEQGLCLKQNGERAARLYLRAADAGASGARSHLAALYASPAAGPDKGAAIWWGLQAGLPLPKPCGVDSEVRANAERFAKVLNDWPAGMLDACVHVTGVLAVLDSEFLVKADAATGDDVAVDFHPANGELAVRTSFVNQEIRDTSPRVVAANNVVGINQVQQNTSADMMRAQQSQADLLDLAKRVESIGRDALVRFPRPAGIAADWRIQLRIQSVRAR
jgi:hypothetical protein